MSGEFLKQMQRFVAESATGPSALRNQGVKGIILSSNKYFKAIPLDAIPIKEAKYAEWLNEHTEQIRALWLDATTEQEKAVLPPKEPLFGAARKALNLFLRSAAYNRYLCEAYAMDRLLPLMEVPVDSYVATRLCDSLPVGSKAKEWPGLKWLTPEQHTEYQKAASVRARELGVYRVDLDAYYYRAEPPAKPQGSEIDEGEEPRYA